MDLASLMERNRKVNFESGMEISAAIRIVFCFKGKIPLKDLSRKR